MVALVTEVVQFWKWREDVGRPRLSDEVVIRRGGDDDERFLPEEDPVSNLSRRKGVRGRYDEDDCTTAYGGIGLISSRLTLEGPIKEDKGSFILSGRRTYADLFFPLFGDEQLENSALYFYDLNAKLNYRVGESDRVFLSAYTGRDNFGFNDEFGSQK